MDSPQLGCVRIYSDLHVDDVAMISLLFSEDIPIAELHAVSTSERKTQLFDVKHLGPFKPQSRDATDFTVFDEIRIPEIKFSDTEVTDIIISGPMELTQLSLTPGVRHVWFLATPGYNTSASTYDGKPLLYPEMMERLQLESEKIGAKLIVLNSIASGFETPKGNLTKFPSSLISNSGVRAWYREFISPVSCSFFLDILNVCREIYCWPHLEKTGRGIETLDAERYLVKEGFVKLMNGYRPENPSPLFADYGEWLVSTMTPGVLESGKYKEYLDFLKDPCVELTDLVSMALIMNPELTEVVSYDIPGRFPVASPDSSPKYGYLLRLRDSKQDEFVKYLDEFLFWWYITFGK